MSRNVEIRNLDSPSFGSFEYMTFPGGEPHVKGNFCPADDYAIVAHVQNFNDMGEILVYNDFLRRNHANRVVLYIPYLPGARQDRGVPLTSKVYADLINSARFDQVICVDPHSDVMPALIDNLTIIDQMEAFSVITPGSADCLVERIGQPHLTTLVAPDAGSVKKVEAFAHRYGYTSVVVASKHRDMSTGKLSGFSCPPIPDTHPWVVVLDDICDGGGTFLGLADVLKYEDGVNVAPYALTLMVTHGIFSKGVKDLKSRYGQIITTDTFTDGWYATTADPRVYTPKAPDIFCLPITDQILNRHV